MTRPNFLIFCVDQMQSYCLGCNGHRQVRTPNIDALAGGGVTFARGYCNNPVCMPSRATMVTGVTPRQHGLLTNGCLLPETVPTVTQALLESGYRTHAVGKMHLQPTGGRAAADFSSWESGAGWRSGAIEALPSPYYGYRRVDFCGGHVNYVFGDYERWLEREHPGLRDKLKPEHAYRRAGNECFRIDMPPEAHYNNWIADRTIDALQGDDPFFLFCSFPDPHHPFAACKPYSEMYDPDEVALPPTAFERTDHTRFMQANRGGNHLNVNPDEAELREIIAQTYGMITHVDDNVGRVLAALEKAGLAENTVVALIADHGEYLGGHDLLHKGGWPWEELVRIPFVWRVPGSERKGVKEETPVSLLDLAPTVADYAGLAGRWWDMRGHGAPETRPGLPGRSLRQYFDGAALAEEPVLLEYDEDCHEDRPICRQRGLVLGDWKLVVWAGFDDGLLVNLRADPRELNNRWDDPACGEIKCELLSRLAERLAYTDRFDTRRYSWA